MTDRSNLMVAAEAGYLEIVKLLIEAGHPIDSQDSGGYTALILSAEAGHIEIVEALI